MWEFFESDFGRTYAQPVLLVAALAILIAIGVYAIRKVRPGGTGPTSGSSELITNFRDLHSKGKLTDNEYRTIRSKLAGDLDQELRSAKPDEATESNSATESNTEDNATPDHGDPESKTGPAGDASAE